MGQGQAAASARPGPGHQRYAVVDGPAGTEVVLAPIRREEAHRLRARTPRGFHCSTAAGGCGGELLLPAGPKVAPYFRHAPGQQQCALERDTAERERGYEHLAIQQHLQRWLLAQGYQAQLEHRFTDGTRADVHVRWSLRRAAEQGHGADPSPESGTAPEPFTSQTLELQLSPLTWPRLQERDERYRQHTDTVTWLFSRRSADLAAMTRAVHGVSFGVWARPEPAGQGHGLAVLIGTHRTAAGTIWEPLENCLLQSGGLWTPSREQALSDHAAEEAMWHQDTNEAGTTE